MADPRFFKLKGPFSLGEIARLVGAELGGAASPDMLIEDVAPLETAGPTQLSFLANKKYADLLGQCRAGAVLVHPGSVAKAPPSAALLITTKPYHAFARAAQAFHPAERPQSGIAPSAYVDPSAILGENVAIGHHAVVEAGVEIGAGSSIGANTVIGTGVVIGADCHIHANVTVSHCLMGDRVTLFPGVRVGQDGFGFAPDQSGHVKVPQLGRVIIGDGVEIGANTTVDRGAGPDTVIGAGTMIDNLVQIAHNVVLGENCVIVALAGIAGSAQLGNFVMIGGQTGVAGHIKVGDGARVAAHSGVMRDLPAGVVVGGEPTVPMKQWMRQIAILQRLANKRES
jgi:UDP-3-O-[3-hydroxymyristoyl] glucosamine N-acyltransferase